jgi:hypothetical protein
MLHGQTVVPCLLGALLIATLVTPLSAQAVDQVSTRRDDAGELYQSPALTWSEGNYHVLHNGVDLDFYGGLGAGGTMDPGLDGIGTWIPGEELRGNHLTSLGDFGYRQRGFRETVAVYDQFPPGASLEINFPYIAWVEIDGGNGHAPIVFNNPVDNDCADWSFGPGTTGYGAPAGEESFLITMSPTAPHDLLVIPNEGVLSGTGSATIIAEIRNLVIPIMDDLHAWEVQIEWVNPLESKDDIDGWYHWTTSSPNNDQYWGLSVDELALWHSFSIPTTSGLTNVQTFFARVEYALLMLSADPVTHAALAPLGAEGTGPFYTTATPGNFNGGFDLGRGSQMLSFSGKSGVWENNNTSNQDPLQAALPVTPALGFVTFDNTDYDGDGDLVGTPPVGGYRLTWIDLDLDVSFGIDPALATSALQWFGSSRVPIQIGSTPGPFPSPTTLSFFPLFVHATTPVAWPDPGGYGGSAGDFGVPMVAGASVFIPLGGIDSVCFVGLSIALQYGSSGLVSSTGPLTWDPAIARVSGTRQIFLFD